MIDKNGAPSSALVTSSAGPGTANRPQIVRTMPCDPQAAAVLRTICRRVALQVADLNACPAFLRWGKAREAMETARWHSRRLGVTSIAEALKQYSRTTRDAAPATVIPAYSRNLALELPAHEFRRHERTLHDFVRHMGDRPLNAITTDAVLAWVATSGSVGAQLKSRKYLRRFWRWAFSRRYVHRRLSLPPQTHPPALDLFFTLRETRIVLNKAATRKCCGYWALGLFAGLRPHELKRWQRLARPWSVVDMRRGVIRLPAAITEAAPRDIEISATLRSWLRYLAVTESPFYARNQKQHNTAILASVRRRRGQCAYQIARNSFLVYTLASSSRRAARVAAGAAVPLHVVHERWLARTTAALAKFYFSLTPAKLFLTAS